MWSFASLKFLITSAAINLRQGCSPFCFLILVIIMVTFCLPVVTAGLGMASVVCSDLVAILLFPEHGPSDKSQVIVPYQSTGLLLSVYTAPPSVFTSFTAPSCALCHLLTLALLLFSCFHIYVAVHNQFTPILLYCSLYISQELTVEVGVE